MGVKVTWTLPALDDLDEILAFIAGDNPAAARIFGRKAIQATRGLRSFPGRGRMVPEYQDPGLRELIVGPVRIIYAFDGGPEIQILAAMRSERRLTPEEGLRDY